MPAPQRPMRRAPQDAQNNAATRGASSTACRRRNPPSLRAGRNPSDAPRADRPRSVHAPGDRAPAPALGFHRRSSRSPPAQHLSYPLPAEPRSIPPTLVRQAPGRPRRTFETPVSARTFARLPPMSAVSRPPADEQTTTRKSAVRRPRNIPHLRLPRHPATRTIPFPHFSRRPQFRRIRADRRASPNAFPKRPSFGCVPPGSSFQPGPGQAARSPRPASVPRADSDFSPALCSLPVPRVRSPAFSCAFPALLPDSVPLFCASFVKKHYKVSTRCAKPLQRRASSRSALRPAPQQHRNVSRRSQVANIKQLLRFRRDCDHAFIAVRSPFPIPRCRARQRFFRIFSSRNPLL